MHFVQIMYDYQGEGGIKLRKTVKKEKKKIQFLFCKSGEEECREEPGGEGKTCLVGMACTWKSTKRRKITVS